MEEKAKSRNRRKKDVPAWLRLVLLPFQKLKLWVKESLLKRRYLRLMSQPSSGVVGRSVSRLRYFWELAKDYASLLFVAAPSHFFRIHGYQPNPEDVPPTGKFLLFFNSYTGLKNFQFKLRTAALGIVAFILIIALILPSGSQSATFTWQQSAWTTQSSNTAVDPDNRTNWTDYSAKDADMNLANGGADLQSGTVSDTPVTQTDDTDSNTGFNLTGKTFSNSEISGSGSGASVNLTYTQSSSPWESRTSLPLANGSGSDLAYPGSGDYIYALRGAGQTTFYRYSISGNAWTTRAVTPLGIGAATGGGALVATSTSNLSIGGQPYSNYLYAYRGNISVSFYRYSIADNSWTTMADMPFGVGPGGDLVYPGPGAYEDYIYGTVGYNGSATGYLYRYTISTGTWTAMANAPTNIFNSGASLVYANGYIYAHGAGGLNYIYSLADNTWASMASDPSNNYGYALVYPGVGDYIYSWSESLHVYRYSISGNSWITLNSAPSVITIGGSMVYPGSGDYIFATQGGSTAFYRYSISGDDLGARWSTAANAPDLISTGAALTAASDGNLYAFKGGGTNTTFYRYSPSNNSWTTMAPVLGTVYFGTDMVNPNSGDYSDYIYCTRGFNTTNLYRYSISGNSWATMASAPGFIYYGGTTAYYKSPVDNQDYILALAGGMTASVYRYSIQDNTWSTMTSAPATIGSSSGGGMEGSSLVYPGSGDYIYATRGINTTTFYRYSISGNSWATMTAAPVGIGNGSTLVYPGSGDYIYTDSGDISNAKTNLMRYSISGNSWTVLSPAPGVFDYGGGMAYPGSGSSIYALKGASTNIFYRYQFKTFSSSGNFTSGVIDTGTSVPIWDNLSWTNSAGKTITVRVRSCDDAACSAAGSINEAATKDFATNCTDVASGGAMSSGNCMASGDRFLQYRASLSTDDTSISPALEDITFNFSYYPASVTLTSSAYDSTDSANSLAKMEWAETLPAGTDAKFQVRTSADGSNWSAWCGPDDGVVGTCSSATYFTDPGGGEVIDDVNSDLTNDQWLQYKVFLTSTGMDTATVSRATMSYVRNAIPTVSYVTVNFAGNGVWNINYDLADDDNSLHTIFFTVNTGVTLADNPLASGATTVNLSGNYANLPTGTQTIQIDQEQITCTSRTDAVLSGCTRARNNTRAASHTQNSIVWFVGTDDNVGGNVGANVSTGIGNTGTWDIKADLDGVYNAAATVRVVANDGQLANQVSLATGAISAGFTLDTKNPSGFGITLDNSLDEVAITAPTENSNYEVYISNELGTLFDNGNKTEPLLNQGSTYPNDYSYAAMTTDPATVYVGVKDTYGNTGYVTKVTPDKPDNVVYYDTSNVSLNEFREFLAWGAISGEQDGDGFAAYSVHRKVDSGSFSQLDTVNNREINYYVDDGLDTDKRYYYKIKTVDVNGNSSDFSSPIVDDQPDGQGGSDSTAPTITGVSISNIETTSATVSWTTDEDANGYVYYSIDPSHDYDEGVQGSPLRGTSHTVNLSGLTPNKTYNIKVESEDFSGNKGVVCSGGTDCSPGSNNTLVFVTPPGPDIFNVRIKATTNTSSTIAWETDADSDSHVIYSDQVSNGELVAPITEGSIEYVGGSYPYKHEVTLTDLSGSVPYYFYVESEGASGTATLKNVTADPPFFTFLTGNDTTPPVINAADPIKILTDTQAAINWSTNEPADSKVEYKKGSENYGDNPPATIASYDFSHYIILSGLDLDTQYTYRLTSKDINGNEATTTDKTFTTLKGADFQHPPLSEITDEDGNDLTDGSQVDNFEPDVLTDVSAVIKFDTDQPAKCMIKYQVATQDYDDDVFVLETKYNDNHSIHLGGLILNTDYKYYIECTDNLGTQVTSDEFGFTTLEEQMTAAEAGAELDTTEPILFNVDSASSTGESTTITWETDEESSSSVAYGIVSGTYDNVASNYEVNSNTDNYVTDHSVIINNLAPSTKYYFVAMSTDAAGNIGQSSEGTFTTASPSSLSSIKVVSTSLNEATITWKTSQPTTSIVEYGLTETYTEKKESNSLTKEHSISLSGLNSGVTYHFRVKGKDADNNIYASGDYTFEPKSPPQISDVAVENITEHEATIKFKTNVPTDALVTYTNVRDPKDTGSQGEPDLVNNHEIQLRNLAAGTTFSMRFRVRDADGNETEEAGREFTTGKDEKPPKIDQVRTDSALSQSDKVQTIISWLTDEPATTTVIFKEGQRGEAKTVDYSANLTTNHVAVITSFKPGTVYYFKAKSVDISGNESISTEYALLTPKRKENIIQIIITNFEDIFSWVKQ